MDLILGSQSPRRREILNFFNLPFRQMTPHFDEEAVPFEDNPKEFIQILSQGKADSLSSHYPDSIILTADTIVYQGGKIFGKPIDEQQAFQYLKELNGKWHSVFTGLTVSTKGDSFHASEETKVLFHSLTDEQMQRYHRDLHFTDKAGGYMIQGAGSIIVKKIEGCYYNVMGLPVNTLYDLLKKVEIDLWQHLKRF